MSKPERKQRGSFQKSPKIKGDPKAPGDDQRSKRATPGRPPAARVPPKRRER